MPKIDLEANAGESIIPEYFEHPTEGYLEYDPNTLYINPNRHGQRPISHPIVMTGKFFGTKQPMVPTCSEPSEGNRGCSKWYGCPLKKYRHVGPGNVIMRKHGTVSMSACYDYFETTRGGRPTSQLHHGIDGWKLDTSRTTVDILGRTWAFESGKLNADSTAAEINATRARKGEMEMGDLLPMWWPLQKKKGLPLHPSAVHYPELAEEDDEEEPEEKPKRRVRANTK